MRSGGSTPLRPELAEADGAIAQAVRIAPDDPDVIEAMGTYAYYAYRDYARATAQYEKLAKLQPNNATVYSSLGLIERREGRWAECLAHFQRAVELDPANIGLARNRLQIVGLCRRWDEARAEHQRLIAMADPLREQLDAAGGEFQATGSMAAADAMLARLTTAQRELPSHCITGRSGRSTGRIMLSSSGSTNSSPRSNPRRRRRIRTFSPAKSISPPVIRPPPGPGWRQPWQNGRRAWRISRPTRPP